MRNRLLFILLWTLVGSPLLTPTAGAQAQKELARRWQGAWVLITTEATSNCDSSYTNNRVRGRFVDGKGSFRFPPGELGKLDKVDLKRSRIDLLIALDEPFLIESHDGPFTLYNEAYCRVELQVEVPREVVKAGAHGLDEAVAQLLGRFETADAARASDSFNRRVRADYPENYEQTLVAYERWRAEQLNLEIQARIDNAITKAVRLSRAVDEDEEYLEGFAAGVSRAREKYFGDCPSILSSSAYGFVKKASSDHDSAWRRGYRQGQELVYHLEVADRLRDCLVPE